ncbi:MAG: methyltransferase [Sulfurimonas sp.]
MKISTEFSKNASSYDSLNNIQNLVVEKLLSLVNTKPHHILDLGCGSGALCKKIDWHYEHFTGVDFAPGMLELHPKSQKIESIYGNFNDKTLFDNLITNKYDYIFSASALQWAESLEDVLINIKKLNAPIALAIFTSNTFQTLNATASLDSLLVSAQSIKKSVDKYFDVNFEVVEYKLEFQSVREMFKYIKRSGVSGSRKVLSFKETKKLMNRYPVNYLEFEVAFITSVLK